MQTAIRPIALNGPEGVRFHQPILPNCWKGESNCIVGPFSGETVARYFANYAVDFGQYEGISYNVFPKRDAWYVEIEQLD